MINAGKRRLSALSLVSMHARCCCARRTPVIMLTGWGQRLVADNDIPLNVDRVLAKPPKLRELREALAQLCQSIATEPTA